MQFFTLVTCVGLIAITCSPNWPTRDRPWLPATDSAFAAVKANTLGASRFEAVLDGRQFAGAR